MSPLCRYCFVQINWVKREGKNIPLDPDGSDHRNTCIPQSTSSQYSKQAKNPPTSKNPATKTREELWNQAKFSSVKIRSSYGRAIPKPVRMEFYDELEVELKEEGITHDDVSCLIKKLQTQIFLQVETNIKRKLLRFNLSDPLE